MSETVCFSANILLISYVAWPIFTSFVLLMLSPSAFIFPKKASIHNMANTGLDKKDAPRRRSAGRHLIFFGQLNDSTRNGVLSIRENLLIPPSKRRRSCGALDLRIPPPRARA